MDLNEHLALFQMEFDSYLDVIFNGHYRPHDMTATLTKENSFNLARQVFELFKS